MVSQFLEWTCRQGRTSLLEVSMTLTLVFMFLLKVQKFFELGISSKHALINVQCKRETAEKRSRTQAEHLDMIVLSSVKTQVKLNRNMAFHIK